MLLNMLPGSQRDGERKKGAVRHLSIRYPSNLYVSIASKLRRLQLDKYLYPLLWSTAPRSPCALILNHGETVNIPEEGRIYKVAAIN